MKRGLVKIAALFFLTILLASNFVNLHVYFHHDVQELDHCQGICHSNENDEDENQDTPCELCHLAFQLNNLDYNTSLEFSFDGLTYIQHTYKKEFTCYIEQLFKEYYFNSNKNKAPPYLA